MMCPTNSDEPRATIISTPLSSPSTAATSARSSSSTAAGGWPARPSTRGTPRPAPGSPRRLAPALEQDGVAAPRPGDDLHERVGARLEDHAEQTERTRTRSRTSPSSSSRRSVAVPTGRAARRADERRRPDVSSFAASRPRRFTSAGGEPARPRPDRWRSRPAPGAHARLAQRRRQRASTFVRPSAEERASRPPASPPAAPARRPRLASDAPITRLSRVMSAS